LRAFATPPRVFLAPPSRVFVAPPFRGFDALLRAASVERGGRAIVRLFDSRSRSPPAG
jgi:hypothetical protein